MPKSSRALALPAGKVCFSVFAAMFHRLPATKEPGSWGLVNLDYRSLAVAGLELYCHGCWFGKRRLVPLLMVQFIAA